MNLLSNFSGGLDEHFGVAASRIYDVFPFGFEIDSSELQRGDALRKRVGPRSRPRCS